MKSKFAIYRNIPRATNIKIHRIDCDIYAGRKPDAENSDWYRAPNLDTARAVTECLAKIYKMKWHYCEKCKPEGARDRGEAPAPSHAGGFAVYRNKPKASDIKIHYADCVWYARRDPSAENSEWHTAPDPASAESLAGRLAAEHRMAYRWCKTCEKRGIPSGGRERAQEPAQDRYVVYHDRAMATDIKIHSMGCRIYKGRNPKAWNADWRTAPDIDAVVEIAKGLAEERGMRYRDCRVCKPRG